MTPRPKPQKCAVCGKRIRYSSTAGLWLHVDFNFWTDAVHAARPITTEDPRTGGED